MTKTVLFAPLLQPGHIHPTLPVSAELVSAGYPVIYLCTRKYASLALSTGAQVHLIHDDHEELDSHQEHLRLCAALAEAVQLLDPVLVLVDIVLTMRRSFEVGAHSGTKLICYSTSLLNWEAGREQGGHVPDLILCAEALEIPKFRAPEGRAMLYGEPGLFPGDSGRSGACGRSGAPLVLISFGTQSVRHRHLLRHYRLAAEVAFERPDHQFLVAAAQALVAGQVVWPANVQLAQHIDQAHVLAKCSAFITHGGLGSIREGIYAGVPMLVLPSFGDQFYNGMRVRYHGLGEALFDENQTAANALVMIDRMRDGQFAQPLCGMRQQFLEAREEHAPRKAILEAIAS